MADASQRTWSNSMPEIYETLLVPVFFQPYAIVAAERIAAEAPESILELAAGSGVVTRELAEMVPEADVTATDLNAGMIEVGRNLAPNAQWQQADALDLPFENAKFDVVLCQFGAMFFPDRPSGFAEARRVLKSDGTFHCALWGTVPENDFADAVVAALQRTFPNNPPNFLSNIPYAYNNADKITEDMRAGGFESINIESVTLDSKAPSARLLAKGFCEGTPLLTQLQERDGLDVAVQAVEKEIEERFDSGPITGKMTAVLVTAS